MSNLKFFYTLYQTIISILFLFFFIGTFLFKYIGYSPSFLMPETESLNFSEPTNSEKYNPDLDSLNTMKSLEDYFLSKLKNNNFSKLDIVYVADNLLREKFLHGNTNFSIQENWFLYIFNYFSINRNNSIYLSNLLPEHILKNNKAICNQQAIIFQNLMAAVNIEYQSILFNINNANNQFGHFASVVKIKDHWYLIDTNMEPNYKKGDKSIIPSLLKGDVDVFNGLYPNHQFKNIPDGSISLSSLNKNPALYGQLIQLFSYYLSNLGWIIFLILFLMSRFIERKTYS
tara:strand:+ start:249 stop:1109 length:861 start_codon:yes stop_codon:yes gene_type:complete